MGPPLVSAHCWVAGCQHDGLLVTPCPSPSLAGAPGCPHPVGHPWDPVNVPSGLIVAPRTLSWPSRPVWAASVPAALQQSARLDHVPGHATLEEASQQPLQAGILDKRDWVMGAHGPGGVSAGGSDAQQDCKGQRQGGRLQGGWLSGCGDQRHMVAAGGSLMVLQSQHHDSCSRKAVSHSCSRKAGGLPAEWPQS